MKKFFLSELPYGILLSLICLFLYFQPSSFLETLELKYYDLRSQWRVPQDPSKNLAIITIDEESIAKIGRWPWPRSRIADLLQFLNQENYKPKTIGLDILFSEPEQNQGLAQINQFRESLRQSIEVKIQETNKLKPKLAAAPWSARQALSWWQKTIDEDKKILDHMDTAYANLDNDTKLETAISSASNIVVPLFFVMGSDGKPSSVSPFMLKSAIVTQQSLSGQEGAAELMHSAQAISPLERFLSVARGLGHVNIEPDSDGSMRRELAAISYGDHTFASFAVEIARHYLGLNAEDVMVNPGESLLLGSTMIALDHKSSFALTFNKPMSAFQTYSFFDVVNGKIAPDAFNNKIVLVGPTAAGIGSSYVTPVAPNMAAVEIVANVIDNLIQKRFLNRPGWAMGAETAAMLLMGLFISFILPRLKALHGALVSMGILAILLGAGFFLFVNQSQWVKFIYPAFVLTSGYIIVISKRFLTTERKKEHIEGESIETNKMLGLSFQGQGMLDLAFEKFRKCPVDDNMKELLYNLGLDFERKRQFNKSAAVYEHISKVDVKYKDIAQKIDTLKKLSEGAIIGSPAGRKSEGTVIIEGSSAKPTLGRYELVKELGKGAMGIVYLGKDPKINRQVAIKTMRFEEDVDAATMKEIKERFFREAESAGNLSHPNILKIYDAGEEQDICYIAMELLEGEDLKKYTEKSALFPIKKTVELMTASADALDYAHQQGIVHRDIKPANLMLLKDNSLRLTDFGIARITASSRTATGAVLGTPSYMSPEQIAGKKVDGRSDIFSLGIVLYELLTGEKPWKGGDSIGSILFQIANDPHPDPRKIRPEIPETLKIIIDKALTKKPEERYQRGGEMAKDLRLFLDGKSIPSNQEISSAPKQPTTPLIPATAADKKIEPVNASAPSQENPLLNKPKPAIAAPSLSLDVQKTLPSISTPPSKTSTPAVAPPVSSTIKEPPKNLTTDTKTLPAMPNLANPSASGQIQTSGAIQPPPPPSKNLSTDKTAQISSPTAPHQPEKIIPAAPAALNKPAPALPPKSEPPAKVPVANPNLESKPAANTPVQPKESQTKQKPPIDKKESTAPRLDDEIRKKLEMLEKTLPIISLPKDPPNP